MVKAIHVLPGTPIIGGQSVSEDLEESYDIYTPDKYIPTELLARYRSARHEKMKNHSTIRACEVFARDFFRLSKEDLA